MTTAINIGFSCRLLTTDMELITLDKEQPGDGKDHVLKRLKVEPRHSRSGALGFRASLA
jgi:hypothetical protein